MKKLLEDILFTGLGTLVVTKEKAEELIEKMVNQGDVTREEGRELLDKFIKKTKQEKDKLSIKFSEELAAKLKKAGFVTSTEIEQLEKRLDRLEHQIQELQEKNN